MRESMTFYPAGEDSGAPTSADDATRMLREIAPVTQRSRQLARDATLARPLLAWGLAWMAGAAAFQYVPGPGGTILGSAATAAAAAVSWLVRPREVRLPTERRFAVMWFAFLVSSPLLVAVAAPANARLMAVFLASLWAVGMVMCGIGMQDVPLAVVGSAILVTAAVARIAAPGAAVLVVGLVGGVGMAALGAWRMRWKR
jgi:hypothetical protein